MAIGRLRQTSFTVSDLDRSVAFYQNVLGLTSEGVTDIGGEALAKVTGFDGCRLRIAMFVVGDYEIELIEYLDPPGPREAAPRNAVGSAHIAFDVDDADRLYRELSAKGVRFTGPPQDFGTVKACYFTDPDGITLEIIERKVTEA